MSRILFDGQIYSIHRRGGITRYFSSLYEESSRTLDSQSNGKLISMGVLFSRYSGGRNSNIFKRPFVLSGPGTAKFALLVNWFYLWMSPYQILHSTYYFRSYLWRRPGTKHVVTLHDMIPEDFPEEFQGGNPHFQKEAYLKDADRIICVSNYTMSRLAHHYPELVHKARVIPCGVADPAPYQSFQERNSSILYVGNRGGYKDFTSILRALPEVIKYEPTIQLLAVGDQKFTESEKSLISELGLTDKVFQKELTNGELYAAYQSCLLTVVSSHVEGFGLPVIEAMSYGALVVATDIPVFREISGEAFVSFQPGNSNDLAKKLTKILKSPEDFEKLREIGIQVAKNYSWQSTLIRLYKLYEEI